MKKSICFAGRSQGLARLTTGTALACIIAIAASSLAYGDAATLRRAKEAGADGVSGKPIDFSALKAEIDQRLIARGVPA